MPIHHALEMEIHEEEDEDDDEEEEEEGASLLREVSGITTPKNGTSSSSGKNGANGGKASSYRNQVNGIDKSSVHSSTPSRTSTSSNFMKRVSTLIVLAILVVFVLRIFNGGSNDSLEVEGMTEKHSRKPSHTVPSSTVNEPEPAPTDTDSDSNPGEEPTTENEDTNEKSDGDDSSDSTPSSTEENENEPLLPQTPREHMYSKISTIPPDLYRSQTFHDEELDEQKKEIQTKYGKWKFWDGDEAHRPTNDYCLGFSHCDVPMDQFPENSWQTDAVFVNHLINDGEQLIARAMEAIFAEYGHGKPLTAAQMGERMQMFHWDKLDSFDPQYYPKPPQKYTKHGDRGNGGYTTKRSYDGLVRRLLHAMMTNDSFTVVLGGHSAAAGHGNHFHQSYVMQFHHVMAPIFARLGVKLITRNLSQGGLGTMHNVLGAGSLYGGEIDLLLWDSGMTENSPAHIDLFIRQGLIGGNRVPVVWAGNFEVMAALHENADVDIGEFGSGTDGIPIVTDETQAATVAYAARYMKCDHDRKEICDNEPRFCASCWLPREDIPNPTDVFDSIDAKVGSQVKWHPGWRVHQLVGRVLAFSVLDALQVAIQRFSDGTMSGPPLDDEFWHVTDYYKNIRSKVMNLDPSIGHCHEIGNDLPSRICNTPMQARSMYTPRANVYETSLTTVIKPAAPDNYIPQNMNKQLYEGPDAHNPCDDLPEDAVDVYAIVSGRRRQRHLEETHMTKKAYLLEEDHMSRISHISPQFENSTMSAFSRSLESDDPILPGRGWEVYDEPPGKCDGEYDSYCKRHKADACPALGHHDARGMILGNEYSGWLVMELPKVKAGIVVMKVVTERLTPEHSTRTVGWETVNNESNGRRLMEYQSIPQSRLLRSLKKEEIKPIELLPETFLFDFAVDGKVTTWNKEEFKNHVKTPQRVLEFITLLDDPAFTTNEKTVEVAFRMRGCGRSCVIGISHIYWA